MNPHQARRNARLCQVRSCTNYGHNIEDGYFHAWNHSDDGKAFALVEDESGNLHNIETQFHIIKFKDRHEGP